MKIGIYGAVQIGGTLARRFSELGHLRLSGQFARPRIPRRRCAEDRRATVSARQVANKPGITCRQHERRRSKAHPAGFPYRRKAG